MQIKSIVAGSILSFCVSASALTGEEYGVYAREAGFLDQEYSYSNHDLYSREAKAEAKAYTESDSGMYLDIDYLHPRGAYNYGLHIGNLQTRESHAEASMTPEQFKKYKAKKEQMKKTLAAKPARMANMKSTGKSKNR